MVVRFGPIARAPSAATSGDVESQTVARARCAVARGPRPTSVGSAGVLAVVGEKPLLVPPSGREDSSVSVSVEWHQELVGSGRGKLVEFRLGIDELKIGIKDCEHRILGVVSIEDGVEANDVGLLSDEQR